MEVVGRDVAVRAVLHDPSVLADLSHGEETEAAPGFCGVVEVAAPSEEQLLSALTAMAGVVAEQGWFDPERSSLVAGTEHVVVAGEEPLMLAMALTRRSGMTREQFQQYWATRHADLGRQVPGSQGYRQVHANELLTEQARSVTGFAGTDYDGVALAYYSDTAAFRGIMANPAIVEPLLEDERRFIDHAQSTFVVGPTLPDRQPG
jgi:hypothetical protein